MRVDEVCDHTERYKSVLVLQECGSNIEHPPHQTRDVTPVLGQ